MHLYTVTVVVDAPPDQNEGEPLRGIQYHTCAATSAQARALTMDHHRASRPADGQVRTVVVDPPCPGGTREACSYPMTLEDLQRLEAGRPVYHV